MPRLTRERLRSHKSFAHLTDQEANHVIGTLRTLAKVSYEIYRQKRRQ